MVAYIDAIGNTEIHGDLILAAAVQTTRGNDLWAEVVEQAQISV